MKLKLGKLAPRHDARTLLFARYASLLPTSPAACTWAPSIGALGVMDNDQYGDCVVAGYGHMIQTWTGADAGKPVVVPDKTILASYFKQSGGDDSGLVMLDACNYWRKTGLSSHKLSAYTAVRPLDSRDVRSAVHLFGGLYAGVSLYLDDMDAFQAGKAWSAKPNGSSIGGHCIPIIGYDPHWVYCVTWAKVQPCSWAWFNARCDEAYCLLAAKDWTGVDAKAPNGFDMAALKADLKAL